MEEIVKTHLPLLAWRGQDGHYQLIHDDIPIGELTIDARGYGAARYHDERWLIEPSSPQISTLRQATTRDVLGELQLHYPADSATPVAGPEEGDIKIEGRLYHCLRDTRKIPIKITLTRPGGLPLLQFRAEDEEHGRIQIDNQTAAGSPDFERLVFWGLYLYLSASPDLQTIPEENSTTSTAVPEETSDLQAVFSSAPPTPPAEDKQTGGHDDAGGSSVSLWLIASIGILIFATAAALRQIKKRY